MGSEFEDMMKGLTEGSEEVTSTLSPERLGAPPPEEDEASISDAFGEIQQFLNHLAPPDELVIMSTVGNQYPIPARFSGRVEIHIMREVKKLAESGIEIPDVQGGMAGMVNAAVQLSSNEEFTDVLESCFTKAFPKIMEAEQSDSNQTPLDLFPLEQLVKVFVPFALGLLQAGKELTGWYNPEPQKK